MFDSMGLEYSILVGGSVSAALEWKTPWVSPYPLFLGCAARGSFPVVVHGLNRQVRVKTEWTWSGRLCAGDPQLIVSHP